MVIKTLLKIKINLFKVAKGQKEGSCSIRVAFPTNMPQDKKDDIMQRINTIIDDIREYL